MATINGSDLMLFTAEGGTLSAIAHATSHTLTLDGEELETSSKDTGKWKDHDVTKLSWSATSENLVGGFDTSDAFSTLVKKWIAREKIDVHMTLASNPDAEGGLPVGGWLPDTTKGWKGKATIQNITLNGQDGQKATMTINLTGSGALTESTV